MNTATRVSAFGLALAVVFGGAWVVGSAAGPFGDEPEAAMSHEAAPAAPNPIPPGLSSAANGYRLELANSTLATGTGDRFEFRVLGPGDVPVTRFEPTHERLLHFVVARRDGSYFQHLHPEMSPEGTWHLGLTVPAGGTYRVLTDFAPTGGPATTLGADVQAAGRFDPVPHPPSRVSTVDGYQVRLDGDLRAGAHSMVTATVSRNGVPVTDLQPYLGAYGHLVALRATDLGYLHVHPEAGAPGPDVHFGVEVPTAGRYRLFLDFQHEGRVHTADFTLDANGTAPTAPMPEEAPHGH